MDEMGDRMKEYEGAESDRRLMHLLPVCARLDGRAFHMFCKHLDRPYDKGFHDLMLDVTLYLVRETGAHIGYTQSDEISLIFYSGDYKSQIFFDGRIMKMVSILAAMATLRFNYSKDEYLMSKTLPRQDPMFDCRVWNVPNKVEACNVLYWRELDATRNSVTMAAQSYFSDKELHGKGGSDKQEMLFTKGVNWNDYPNFFKRGQYVQRRKVVRKFTSSELDSLPPKHAARANPDLMVERTDVVMLDMPPFGKVANKVEVVFEGAEPIVESA